MDKNNKGEYDDDEHYSDNSGIQQVQSKEDNEKDLQQKRELLLQQIQKSLLQEDTQTTITTLRLISLIIFSALIIYGLIFLVILINNFASNDDKFLYIKYSFAIYRGILHCTIIVRELVLISFEEYNNAFVLKDKYKTNLYNSLTTLYVRISDYIDQLTKKSSQLSEENYQTVFGTILPTYIINPDYTVNIFNLTYISTVSKASTGIFEITQLSDSDFMPLNKDIYFFLTNTLNGILTDTRIAEKTYTDQLEALIKTQKKNLLILFIIVSFLNIITYFIINKAFSDVDARKNSYLEVFFEIKGNLIISSLTKCENFVKRLQNTDNDDIISIQDDEDNDDMDVTIQNHKNYSSEGEGNKITSRNVIIINSIVIAMICFIIIYFLIIILLYYNFSEDFLKFQSLFLHESRIQMEHFLLYCYLREYIFDPKTLVNSTEIDTLIDGIMKNYTLHQIDNEKIIKKYHYLYNDNFTQLRYKIFHTDICNYSTNFFEEFGDLMENFDCYSFLHGSAKYGLEIFHSNFYEELRSIKARIEIAKKKWDEYNFTYNLTLYKTENYFKFRNSLEEELKPIYDENSPLTLLMNSKMKLLTIVIEYFLSPIYIELFDSVEQVIMEYVKTKKKILLSMCIVFILLFFLIYILIWRRYVESLNTIIYQTKRMLAIIPKDILASLKSIGKLLDIKTQGAQKISDHKSMRLSSKVKKNNEDHQSNPTTINQNDNLGANNNNPLSPHEIH